MNKISDNANRIMVIGGAGYIGSHVVKHLVKSGSDLVVFDNFSSGHRDNIVPGVEIIEGDILNEAELDNAMSKKIDAVIHLAAFKDAGESMEEPSKYAINNITGSLNILKQMSKHNVKYIVFSSSAAVYGYPEYLPVDENHPLKPENYYGYTKLVIEQNIEWFSRLGDIHFANLRYFNAAGYDVEGVIRHKESNPGNLIPIVFEVAAGIREKVIVFGNDYDTKDGTGVRDYIHVDDLADAHLKSLDFILKDNSTTLNLGTGEGYSVLEVIRMVEELTGKTIAVDIAPRRRGDCAELIAKSLCADEILGWKPKYSTLKQIIESMTCVYI